MYWRDIGYLCKANKHLDAMRRATKSGFERREVPCNEKGIKRNEVYQAAVAGVKPELCIEIKADEYQREAYFEYKGIMYSIVRTYPVKNENLELILTTLTKDNV